MRRSAALRGLLTVILGAGWLACFGDDPDVSSSRDDLPAGEDGGSCLEAGSCQDGSADQSAPVDSATTNDAEGGSACGAVLLPANAAGVPCPRGGTVTACTGQETCCIEQGAGSPCIAPTVGCGGTIWNCASQSDCGGGQRCCLDGPSGIAAAPDTCGVGLTFKGPRGTQCRGSCATKEHELCDEAGIAGGCSGARQCVRARATLAATDVLFNACVD